MAILPVFNSHAGQLCISAITFAELLHGAEKSTQVEHQLRQVEDFVSRLDVLDYGIKAAAHYGDIRADLERKGLSIGVNDLHIAGHARSKGLTLITNNPHEFERITGLQLDYKIIGVNSQDRRAHYPACAITINRYI